jgi:hypothetical protein
MEGLAAREIGDGVVERWTDAIVTRRGRAFLRMIAHDCGYHPSVSGNREETQLFCRGGRE